MKTLKVISVLKKLGFTQLKEVVYAYHHEETGLVVSIPKTIDIAPVMYGAVRYQLNAWGIVSNHDFDKMTGY